MSPEQAEGRRVDDRSDLFSLGVVIYELLTGSCPFQRETTMGTIAAILRDGPAPLSPENTSALRSIVEKCLEKESSRRYSSAAELAAALVAVQFDAVEPAASLAILPLANLSNSVEDQYFVDGLTHELIHALSRVDGLKVAGRSGAFRFKGGDHDIKEVGRSLGVRRVYKGASHYRRSTPCHGRTGPGRGRLCPVVGPVRPSRSGTSSRSRMKSVPRSSGRSAKS